MVQQVDHFGYLHGFFRVAPLEQNISEIASRWCDFNWPTKKI